MSGDVAPWEHQDFTGQGKRVVRLAAIEDYALLFFEAKSKDGLTSVWGLDEDGEQAELLANRIGGYQGVTLIEAETPVHALQISTPGAWSARVRPLSAARPWTQARLNGTGNDGLRLADKIRGLTTVTMKTRDASGLTVVWAHGKDSRTLLFNGIGPMDAETVLPRGTRLVAVRCDGNWALQYES